MRNFMQMTLASCLLLVLSHSSFGQQGIRTFPWRAQRGQIPAQQTGTIINEGTPNTIPPIVRPSQPAVSILQQDQQDAAAQAQPTQEYPFGNTPAANGQDAYQGADPALSVQSNAIAENCGFCQQDCFHDIGCPKRLFGTNSHGTEIGGWAQAGWSSDSTGLFNDRPDELNLNQFWFYAGRRANANRRFGYRMDVVYGTDAQNTQAFGNPPTGNATGWDNGWDNGAYGWALPQAYVETCLNNGATLRIGKFLSPFGCEKIPAIENFFYSRTYTRTYTEPFTMTGAIAERNLSPTSSYIVGATLGWDTGFDSNSGFNVLTGFRFQLNENISVRATSSYGDTGRLRGSGTLNSVITNVKLLPRVFYTAQVDMLNLNVDSNDEYSLIQYLTYRASDVVAWGGRLEWWKSDQFSVATQSTWSATFGANVRPHSNFMIRPEIRYDWGPQAANPDVSIFGIDAIILF